MQLPLMELSKLFGLPAHPLLVHAAVVLVPLAALGLVAVGWRETWRRVYYLPLALIAIAGAGASFLAKESGEPLAHSVRQAGKRVGEHPEQGDTAFVFAAALAATFVVLFAWERFGAAIRARLGWEDRLRLPIADDVLLYAISIPIALIAVYTMVVAGHSGATLVWKTNR